VTSKTPTATACASPHLAPDELHGSGTAATGVREGRGHAKRAGFSFDRDPALLMDGSGRCRRVVAESAANRSRGHAVDPAFRARQGPSLVRRACPRPSKSRVSRVTDGAAGSRLQRSCPGCGCFRDRLEAPAWCLGGRQRCSFGTISSAWTSLTMTPPGVLSSLRSGALMRPICRS
jgi:hypothetical protein